MQSATAGEKNKIKKKIKFVWYPTSIWQVIIGCFKKSKEKMMGILENQSRAGVSFFEMLDEYLCFTTLPSKTLQFSAKCFRFPEDELTVNIPQNARWNENQVWNLG